MGEWVIRLVGAIQRDSNPSLDWVGHFEAHKDDLTVVGRVLWGQPQDKVLAAAIHTQGRQHTEQVRREIVLNYARYRLGGEDVRLLEWVASSNQMIEYRLEATSEQLQCWLRDWGIVSDSRFHSLVR